ncbi:hypothetical protein BpHYR1_049103 [Brachionus plicatilis]|uniref:Uncharacterized protein n=1 Tax=Brachionus plicatilis TaxID=10195 RepID=A0A3M7PV35_BRAPC|nr:hypothetical protein BpHYR1_049103 [Brachionus plicatilis]
MPQQKPFGTAKNSFGRPKNSLERQNFKFRANSILSNHHNRLRQY